MLILKQALALIVIWNNAIYTCACVPVCIYFVSHYIYYFLQYLVSWLFVFVSITSNSFDVNSDDFCLLKIWIYKLMCWTMKTTLWVLKKTEPFQRKVLLSYSRNCCCWYQCENFKREWNSVVTICSESCISSFFKKYNRLRLFTGILV